ncbi:MAG TPA: O-antigen ligase family protein [Anaerolineales bacterium]
MRTKLSRYAEGLMEAAWLAAVVAVPVFFNVYSSRIFEPDKITLLRTLALLILGAWIIKLLDEGGLQWQRARPGESRVKSFLRIPMIMPVVALAAVYLLSTLLSVNPRVSFAGSYQRLQGTYTTLSYLVIFAAVAGNLRRREQIERLITVAIIASLPVSLYGVLQRYQIDPVPWGSDTSRRIAANMGNPIFVAAYLIMVFPLTLHRIIESFSAILSDAGELLGNFSRSTAYVFIAALQLIALFLTGSRGPWLGWMAGTFFMFLMLSLLWRKRWMTLGIVGLAVLGAVSLVLLNVPGGPLESMRSLPGVGRLGQLLDADSRTGRVRTLIWQGAAELVLPHEPLEYPDGRQDVFNVLRPVIGYGPESMYVAYNPFYPPELTQVEKRNASPDRSHNETWDVLVRTGVLGLIVYLALFGTVFYYGLKWLGMITARRQRNLFLGLYLGAGLVTAAGFVLAMGLEFFGVGLPFGMVIGVLIYLILISLSGGYQDPRTQAERLRAFLIMALLAVVVAHFAEINFGIAIAATRTYFWVFSALILVLGYVLANNQAYEGVFAPPEDAAGETYPGRNKNKSKSDRKRRRGRADNSGDASGAAPWWREAALNGLVAALVLIPLGYNFLTNRASAASAFDLIWTSMVNLPTLLNSTVSYGVLAMVLMAWLFAGVLLTSESTKLRPALPWGHLLLAGLGVALLVSLFYWLWHAGGLVAIARSTASDIDGLLDNVGLFEALLSRYYVYYFGLVFGLAFFLPDQWPARTLSTTWVGALAVPAVFVLVAYLGVVTNLRVIHADIAFKVADSFSNQGSYPAAIAIYDHAIDLAPSEDYYFLFLGKSYLDYGRALEDPFQREQLISRAKSDLETAQNLNPLHPDHTANLARLYSLWATFAEDPETRLARAQISSGYFSRATTISPNNARLWDEWGILYLNVLGQPDQAYDYFTHALDIDAQYDWTHALLGDYYLNASRDRENPAEQGELLAQAADHYRRALDLVNSRDTQNRYSYSLALAGVHAQLGQPQAAISAYENATQVLPQNPDRWRIEEAIGRLYIQVGDQTSAYDHLAAALAVAPGDQKERLQTLVAQLQTQQ